MTSEDRNVQYFNEVHKTSYTKAEIEGIYWLCDIHKLKTADAIGYAHKCHTCGSKIETIGNEFCSPDCKITNNIRHHFPGHMCYWGPECKICTQAYKTNGSNYADYELESDEIEVEDTYDDLEYSDDFEDEEEPLISLKKPIELISYNHDLSKPVLERGSNYISSDEEDRLVSTLPVNNCHSKENEENMVDLVIRLFSLPTK